MAVPPTTADGLGVAVGQDVVRPFMNDRNSKEKVAAFAKEFRSWFGNDKARAMAEYEFGTIGSKSSIPFGSKSSQKNYVNDALGVGDHVKKLLRKTLVNNYFSDHPKAMRFTISVTSKQGGDLEVGIVENADGDEFISVRILCMKPGP
jgi:hypothetical protein